MISRIRFLIASTLLATLIVTIWVSAQESKPGSSVSTSLVQTTSLRLAPADSSLFITSLRLKDRLLSLWNTRAVQQIWKTPLVQAGWTEVTQNMNQQATPLGTFLEQKENKELLQLLLDMASEECFLIGGPALPSFLTMAGDIIGSAYAGAAGSPLNAGGDPVMGPLHTVLSVLQENIDKLKIPDLVVGFKVNDAKVAQRQVARLAVLLNAAAMAVPPLTGNVKNQKIRDFNLTTITLDGAKMPWEMIPWDRVEENAGEFQDLRNQFRKMKLTITLGYYEGYIVVSLGESTAFLERLGQGKKLAELDEFKPLKKNLDKRITSISYSSKEMNSGSGFTQDQADAWATEFLKMVEDSQLEDEQRDRLERDIKALSKDMLALAGREPGSAISFSFQTSRGEESFSYQYSIDPRVNYSKELGLLQHVGADPILAAVGRGVYKPEAWDIYVKWLKKAEGYFRDFGLPAIEQFAGKDTVDQIEKVLEDMYPFLRRLDQTVRANLLPALADGQSAFVIDHQLVSTQWHRDLPASKTPLPMLEPALVMGISDRAKLMKAAEDIRAIFNGVAKYFHEMQPDSIPSVHWPAPETMKMDGILLFWYAFPDELKLDGRLKPTAGLSDSVAALTVTNEHAIRLLQAKPLVLDGGPLSDQKQKLGAAVVFKMPALVQTAVPWVDYILQNPEMKDMQQHAKDIRTILSSFKLFHTYSSVTYVEDRATVTRSEWHLIDLP